MLRRPAGTRLAGALGAALVVATAVPATRVPALLLATALACVAPMAGVLLHRPPQRGPWFAAITMIWLWAAGLGTLRVTGDRDLAGWLIEAGALVAAGMVGYLLLAWQRRRPQDRRGPSGRGEALGRRADQMVVGCTVVLGGAQMVAAVLMPSFGPGTWAVVISPLDVVLACLLLRFLASRARLRPGSVLALSASLVTCAYDMLATTGGHRAATLESPLSVLWSLAAVLYVGAGLHPTMVSTFTAATLQSRRSESGRLLGLAPLTLAPVALYAVGAVGLDTRLPVPVYLTAGGVIALIVVVRGAQGVLTSERRAERDPLTGLANRRGLVRAFARLREGAETSGPVLGRLLLVDVDDFKHVNDTFGHEAGDRLLVQIGARLTSVVGADGTVARSGGDEFVVLVEATGPSPESLVTAAFAQPFELGPGTGTRPRGVRASAGWAPVTAESHLGRTLADADIALYASKDAGKDVVTGFREELREDVLGRLSMVEDLRRLLDGGTDAGSLELRYQPLVRLADDRVLGAEVLVRWQHPERGLLSPDSFLPLAEEHGFGAQIDEEVLRRGLRQLAAWDAEGLPQLFLSANLGRSSMLDPDLATGVRSALGAAGVAPDRLHLEITEHAELPAAAGVDALWSLAAAGVRVSLDDFGIGYTSLDYVRRYPISTLKLDRSITEPLQHEPVSPLLRGVVLLAGSLDIEVLAEGIETGVQKERLAALGVQLGQGYVLAHPLTSADFRTQVGRRREVVRAGA